MFGNTLSGRLFLLSSFWAVFSIALIAFFISNGYRNSAEARLTQLLSANLYNLMGVIEPDEAGKLSGLPDLRDARFLNFQSGYYWSVVEINNPENRVSSVSLADEVITQSSNTSFDSNFERKFHTQDKAGNKIIGVEAHIFLGEGDRLYSFKITANKDDLNQEVNTFIRDLVLLLVLFAIGFVLATYFLVRFGLSPLREVSDRLTDIREGKAERLEGDFPKEIQPLVDETNSMIQSNNLVIERARTQVGNLAHALKTPLAVLKNEAGGASPKIKKILDQQTTQMHNHVQSYLERAQIAARAGSVTSRTKINNVVERMLRVMAKLNPDLNFTFKGADLNLVFAGEQQDLEEILGNLLENAAKFAKSDIVISSKLGEEANSLKIVVEDDGEGLTEKDMKKAMARGVRLDETKPGTGLGLSIVKDIASEYDGEITLSTSSLGGLKAALKLPRR